MTQLRNSTIPVTGGASGNGRPMGLMSLRRRAIAFVTWNLDRHNLHAVEKYRIILRKSALVHLIPLLQGMLPARLFDLLLRTGFKACLIMDHFTGCLGNQPVPQPKQNFKL